MALLAPDDLARLEAAVGRALDGSAGDLRILGHGEITLVVGWPTEAPVVAAKRLPPFADRDRAEAYGAVVADYVAALARRGVPCVESGFGITESDDGWAAYVVQPLLDPDTLGPARLRVLAAEDPSGARARALLERVVEHIVVAVGGEVGLDGQLSNWADTPEGLRYFDVTTPLLNDATGRSRLDLGTLTSPLPAPLRPVVRRFVAPGITAKYHDVRSVLLDLAANLHKERLARWVNATLVAANRHVAPAITPEEALAYYRSDARTWEALLRLRTADRWWHRRVLRRRYGSLLPLDTER